MDLSLAEANRAMIARAQSDDPSDADAATEELVRENVGLVRSIALKFCGRGCELDDLVQIGTIGMIKAVRSFDLSRGTAFSTYAVPLIMGEIRRHLRDDGPVKVGRAVKRLACELMRAQEEILESTGREATLSELASRCGVSREEAACALDALSPVRSLSDGQNENGDGSALCDRIENEEGLFEIERARDKIALAQLIKTMPPLWRRITILRYYRDLTQQKTAELLGLTQVKISREEKKIVLFLRNELLK